MKFFDFDFNKLKNFLSKLTEVLLLFVSVSLLLVSYLDLTQPYWWSLPKLCKYSFWLRSGWCRSSYCFSHNFCNLKKV